MSTHRERLNEEIKKAGGILQDGERSNTVGVLMAEADVYYHEAVLPRRKEEEEQREEAWKRWEGPSLSRIDKAMLLAIPSIPFGVLFGGVLADAISKGSSGWGALGGFAVGMLTAVIGSRKSNH